MYTHLMHSNIRTLLILWSCLIGSDVVASVVGSSPLASPIDTGSDLYLKQHNATIPCASKSLTAPLGLNEVVDLALCNNPQTREANET